jgi:hypothetical protein
MANAYDTMGTNAVPLLPATGFTLVQQTASTAVDIATLQAASSGTGDYLVLRNASQTERFVIEDGGNVVITQSAAADVGIKVVQASTPTVSPIQVLANDASTVRFALTKNHGLQLRVRTTRPTTGLTKGEVLLLFHGSTPKIGICTSTAGQTIKLIRARTKTFGRLTA